MKKKKTSKVKKAVSSCSCSTSHNTCGGGAYFLGMIGAAVYYISTTSGFWNIVLAILKSLVWPAFLVFELLKFIGV